MCLLYYVYFQDDDLERGRCVCVYFRDNDLGRGGSVFTSKTMILEGEGMCVLPRQ